MQREKTYQLVPADENRRISRLLLAWLNKYPDIPVNRIGFEYLSDNTGMALSTIQSAYKTKQYIGGGYQAQYQFKLIFRSYPANDNERLECDEMLESIAEWAEDKNNKPFLGDGITPISVKRNTSSALFARYEDGAEDYQIMMTLIYEVI